MSEENGSGIVPGNPPVDGGTPPGAPPAPEAKWYSGIENADTRGYAELKGWKDPGAAIESYRNLEKLQGVPAERLAKIPEANDADGWKAFNAKFGWGAPDTADGYDLPVPEGQSDALASKLKPIFHELGIPADKAKSLVEKYNAAIGEMGAADEQALAVHNTTELAKLKSEWGGNYDGLAQLADRARKEILPTSGLTEDQLGLMEEVMGPAAMIRLFAAFGQKAGEAKFIEGGGSSNNGPMSPEAAQARLDQLGQDKEWGKRFFAGGVTEQQEFRKLQMIVANATLQR